MQACPSLAECFQQFDLIHRAVCTEEALARVAYEAVCDAAQDGVRYLELRTTPRALRGAGSGDAALEAYLAAVAGGVLAASSGARAAQHPPCAVRLLLSFDRAAPREAWEGVARLARQWHGREFLGLQPFPAVPTVLLVGVDVSGHPGRGDLATLFPILDFLRAVGLKVALHTAELAGSQEEVGRILDWRPDRLGHMCHLSLAHLSAVSQGSWSIELCPTSNCITLQLAEGLQGHPTMGALLGSPTLKLAICTDDCGVFSTTLSREYGLVAQAFALPRERMEALAKASFDCGFANAGELEASRLLTA